MDRSRKEHPSPSHPREDVEKREVRAQYFIGIVLDQLLHVDRAVKRQLADCYVMYVRDGKEEYLDAFLRLLKYAQNKEYITSTQAGLLRTQYDRFVPLLDERVNIAFVYDADEERVTDEEDVPKNASEGDTLAVQVKVYLNQYLDKAVKKIPVGEEIFSAEEIRIFFYWLDTDLQRAYRVLDDTFIQKIRLSNEQYFFLCLRNLIASMKKRYPSLVSSTPQNTIIDRYYQICQLMASFEEQK